MESPWLQRRSFQSRFHAFWSECTAGRIRTRNQVWINSTDEANGPERSPSSAAGLQFAEVLQVILSKTVRLNHAGIRSDFNSNFRPSVISANQVCWRS